jgi:hypothetical protein
MVVSFSPDDELRQLGIVEVNVLDRFGLCIRWSGNENCTGVCDRFGDFVKIVVIRRGVPAPNGVCFVMDVFGG